MMTFDISSSDFATIRNNKKYYVDKTLFIKEFIEQNEQITLITRPRRFGKTTAMTMLADFFDIEKDSKEHFAGLHIMDTEYASLMNTRPVVFLSFRDCDGTTAEELRLALNQNLFKAMENLEHILHDRIDVQRRKNKQFYILLDRFMRKEAGYDEIADSLDLMISLCNDCYGMQPLVIIDEYDQPLLASHMYHFHEQIGVALAAFYTRALKDNPFVYKAVMTGIQRIAKESIFSKFNNPVVYTVMDKTYSTTFGFTEEETRRLLSDAGLILDERTNDMYDGYRFAGTGIYNPSSIMGYAQKKELKSFWLNTSANTLIHEAIQNARLEDAFRLDYEELLEKGQVTVSASLETSFIELGNVSTLWGLLINAGYLTVLAHDEIEGSTVSIPNREVRGEFLRMIGNEMGAAPNVLQSMFSALDTRNMELFLKMYRRLVLTCTSYHDGKENAYHMFFLGMCVFLHGKYQVTSNLESGLGRHDIMMIPLKNNLEPVIVEFKQFAVSDKSVDLHVMADDALDQIKDKKYYAPVCGNILLVGIAHQGKLCEMKYEFFRHDALEY